MTKAVWMLHAKKADFNGLAARFHISPITARIIRNRDITDIDEFNKYLNGSLKDLYEPRLLPDMEKAISILKEKIAAGVRIRIVGDYDIDGVCSTCILYKGLSRVGASVDYVIPERIKDGYGINEHIIEKAAADGIHMILTCDNGIAAIDQIAEAKELGMTVVITDHHDIQVDEVSETEIMPSADAIVNPKRKDSKYPFSEICGAMVAYKLIQVLFEEYGIDRQEWLDMLELAAIATVGDVMKLKDENRIVVKEGLKKLANTKIQGLVSLMEKNTLDPEHISAYHVGFVLGPCLNASGRLDTARLSLKLLLCESETEAAVLAEEIVELNESRKLLTMHAVEQAKEIAQQEEYVNDRVLVIFLPDCHESLAGIVAGRIREAYYRPTLVVTRSEHGAKGSGRSIEGYSMYEELCKCEEYLTQFGGHPMAAGFSLKEADIDAFRRKLNEVCTLTEEELRPKVVIDVPMPISYITERLVNQLGCLEPFGKGNEKPVFADRNLVIERLRICGKEGRVFQMKVRNAAGVSMDAVYFGDVEDLLLPLAEKYGKVVAQDTLAGRCVHEAALHFTYYPEMDHYYETPRIKLRLTGVSV